MTAKRVQLISEYLQRELKPTHLEVIDESHYHRGHPGAQSGAGHFKVIISSPLFAGQNDIACHRLVYAALTDLMGGEIHALTIQTTVIPA